MDPVTMQALMTGAGSVVGGITGGRGKGKHDYAAARRETFAAFPGYLNMLMGAGMPQLNLALNQASIQGAQLGQDVSSALGSLGGGSTGVGALTRGVANTFAGQMQSQARMGWMQQMMENALNMLAMNLSAGQARG